MLPQLLGSGPPVHRLYTVPIPVAYGVVNLRVYDPVTEPVHTLLWFHGGGWVLGDVESFDAVCATLAVGSSIRVVSANYRLAPEYPYPIPVDDCMAALLWTNENLLGVGGKLLVGGDSAGGNLAAVVCRRARDARAPEIRLQILVYPVADHDLTRPSYLNHGDGSLPLGTEEMRWFWGHYLPDVLGRSSGDASPWRTPDLSGLPPAYILLAEYDVLLDEGLAYAERLELAGVKTVVEISPGTIHGFYHMVGYFRAADDAVRRTCAAIRQAVQG